MAARRLITLFSLILAAILMLQARPARPQPPAARNTGDTANTTLLGDANALFDLLSRGGQTLAISGTGPMRGALTEYALQQGILGDSITRREFADFASQLTVQSLLADGKTPAVSLPQSMLGYGTDQDAMLAFLRRDLDGNGVLDWSEMEPSLRDSLAYWDINGDGVIEFVEYKFFYRAKMDGRQIRQTARVREALHHHYFEHDDADLSQLDQRPMVWRFGHLPGGLPEWFTELDFDEDGQIGLYEWRKSGKSVEEFMAIDRNGDGLITAEELLFFQSK